MTTPTGLELVWADAGGTSDPGDSKYQLGWVAEIPTFQNFNFVLQNLDKAKLSYAEGDIYPWQGSIAYKAGARVKRNGKTFYCVTPHNDSGNTDPQDPSLDVNGSYWVSGTVFSSVVDAFTNLNMRDGVKIDQVNPRGDKTLWGGNDVTVHNGNAIIALNTPTPSDSNLLFGNVNGKIVVVNVGTKTVADGTTSLLPSVNPDAHEIYHEGNKPKQVDVEGTIPKNPEDGVLYGRRNGNWVKVTAIDVQTAPPPPVAGNGSGWYNLDDGTFYVDIDDGDSSQWVPASPPNVPINFDDTHILADNSTTSRDLSARFADVINVYDYGAVGDGVADDTAALNAAFTQANSGSKSVTMQGRFRVTGVVNFPSAKVFGPCSVSVESTGASTNLASNSELVDIIFEFNKQANRQLVADNKDNIVLEKVRCTNSDNNGFYIVNCRNVTLRKCLADNNASRGFYIAANTGYSSSRIGIIDCKAFSNGLDGITVAGQGQNDDIGQVANPIQHVTITGCITNNNGTTGNNGINWPYTRFLTVSNCISYSNAEHGFSCQESTEWTVSNCIAYGNGEAGMNMQSGYNPNLPAANGLISNCMFYNNDKGLTFKEQCENILISNCQLIDNTSYTVRFRDISSSGLHSDLIVFTGCHLTTGVTNGNNSTRISIEDSVNILSNQVVQPNTMVNEDVTESITLETRGALFTSPELLYVTTLTGSDISRTNMNQATRGRRIYIQNDSAGTFRIRHNTGGSGSLAVFINKSGATDTVLVDEIRTYIADGTRWVQQ